MNYAHVMSIFVELPFRLRQGTCLFVAVALICLELHIKKIILSKRFSILMSCLIKKCSSKPQQTITVQIATLCVQVSTLGPRLDINYLN